MDGVLEEGWVVAIAVEADYLHSYAVGTFFGDTSTFHPRYEDIYL